MSNILVNRYLTKTDFNLDKDGFLVGKPTYINGTFEYSYDEYYTLEKFIKENFGIIVALGGTGKSTFLNQIENKLKTENDINIIRINLRDIDFTTNLENLIHCNANELNYILLDAVDEAFDLNITTINNKIYDTISKLKDIYKLHLYITTRSNSMIEDLAAKLKNIFMIKNNEDCIFQLCPFSKENIIEIAQNANIKNSDEFISKIINYNLVCFANNPNTLKALIELYKNDKLNQNITHYDLFEFLIKNLLKESDYRENLALSGNNNFKIISEKESLFIASKLMFELMINKRNYLSFTQTDENTLCINNISNKVYKNKQNESFELTTENIERILKTKLFNFSNNKYSIQEMPYREFLIAYYLRLLNLSSEKYLNLFSINGLVHPNYTEIISFLAVDNDKIFKFCVKENASILINSFVIFNKNEQRKILFKEYIKNIKADNSRVFNYSTKLNKLFFDGIFDVIKKYLKTNIITLLKDKNNENQIEQLIKLLNY